MLYYSRLTGVFPEDSEIWIGDSVNLGELAQFRDSFRVESLQVGPGGAQEDQLRIWAAANQLPDIYLTDRLAVCAANGWAADLSTTAGTHRSLASDGVYLSMIEGAKSGARLFGIPASFTTPLMVCDRQSAQAQGVRLPDSQSWAFEDFAQEIISANAIFAETPQANDSNTTTTHVSQPPARPLYSLTGLLELLPAGLDPSLGWAAWTGARFGIDQEAFLEAARCLQRLASDGTDLPPSAEEGQFAIQLADSSELPMARRRLGQHLSVMRVPYIEWERMGVRVQTFCLSPDAARSQSLIDFALFVALDPDALLLGARFVQHEGYLPVSKEARVWERTVMTWPSAGFFEAARPLFSQAFIDGRSCVPGWDAFVSGKLRVAEQNILQGVKTAEEMVAWLNGSPDVEREGWHESES